MNCVSKNRSRLRQQTALRYIGMCVRSGFGVSSPPLSLATTSPFLIMGVLNVTPDSFSDGGLYLDPHHAYAQAVKLCEQGADIIDIGGESTRPSATPVAAPEEWRRLQPVLELLSKASLPAALSVDTRKAEIAARLFDYPIALLNDCGAQLPHTLLRRWAAEGRSYLAMHMHGEPRTMQRQPLTAEQIMPCLIAFFKSRVTLWQACGFAEEQIWIDPGIGFGKTDKAIMRIFAELKTLSSIAATAVGVSRKSWLGRNLHIEQPPARDKVSSVLELALVWQGAKLIRTHTVEALNRLRKLLH